jgi:hypothetical protein
MSLVSSAGSQLAEDNSDFTPRLIDNETVFPIEFWTNACDILKSFTHTIPIQMTD